MKWKNKTRKAQKVCQCCGCSDINKLEIHHCLPRSLYPEYRADDRNLVCLCSTCHKHLHEDVAPPEMPNLCDFLTLVELFVRYGNRKKWNKRAFMQDVLAKAKAGYYETHLI